MATRERLIKILMGIRTPPVIPAKTGIQGAEIRAPAPGSSPGRALDPGFSGVTTSVG